MFLDYLTQYQSLGYWIVFVGMMAEGDILLFTVGFLVHRGYFNADLTLLVIFWGVIIGDNIWYVFGETMSEKSFFGRFITRVTQPFDEHLRNKTVRTIFISKFAYGLYRPIILRAGMLRLSFKQFIEGDIAASVLWIFLVGGLGYLSSASFFLIRRYLRYTEVSLLFGLILFILVSNFLRRLSKKEL